MRKPYVVCGGLQDNGSWCGPSGVRSQNGILNSDWFRVGGGDGFYTANDWSDWRTVYAESQDGATQRLDLGRGKAVGTRARAPAGRGGQQLPAWAEGVDPSVLAQFGFGPGAANGNVAPPPPPGTAFRFYWNTPFQLSPHSPSTIYLGAERMFKSMHRGNTWVLSGDLTRNVRPNPHPTTALTVHSADGQRSRAPGGQPDPQSAVPRYGVRNLCVGRRRQVVEAAGAGHARGPRRRPHHPPARAGSHRRYPRPQHLDPRRHLAAGGNDGPDDDG